MKTDTCLEIALSLPPGVEEEEEEEVVAVVEEVLALRYGSILFCFIISPGI
jgi:hypothetical protein